jgi:hypothetical protein
MILKQIQKIENIQNAIEKTKSPYLKRDLTKQLNGERKELKQAIIFLRG